MKKREKRLVSHIISDGVLLRQELSRMTLTVEGREQVLITGCKRIACYTERCISLELTDANLAVEGCYLTMKTYFGDRILISGIIEALRFEV